jgi:hypothetical protein
VTLVIARLASVFTNAFGAFTFIFGLILVVPIARVMMALAKTIKRRRSTITIIIILLLGVFTAYVIAMSFVPYFALLSVLRKRAYALPCDELPITAYLTGSSRGILTSWDGSDPNDFVTARLFSSMDGSPVATWFLTKPGNATIAFAPLDKDGAPPVDGSKAEIVYDLVKFTAHTKGGYHSTFGNGTTFIDEVSVSGPEDGQKERWSKSVYRELEVNLEPPDFRIRDNNGDGITKAKGSIVLRSLAIDPNNCRQLKVCLTAWNVEKDPQQALQAMVPLGLALYYQALWGFNCG